MLKSPSFTAVHRPPAFALRVHDVLGENRHHQETDGMYLLAGLPRAESSALMHVERRPSSRPRWCMAACRSSAGRNRFSCHSA